MTEYLPNPTLVTTAMRLPCEMASGGNYGPIEPHRTYDPMTSHLSPGFSTTVLAWAEQSSRAMS